ncbi:hypothetical protein AB0A69_16665 [Streptomyces sp. NPDC045431]|uniref:hypothetical protein n=1 Tax=Streptomyces sp. NPDC045431 TaxID=3155613 RepID=UPI0033DE6807
MKKKRVGLGVLAAVGALALLAVGVDAGAKKVSELWNGRPYPAADPAAVSQKLQERSQWTYDGFGLPPATAGAVQAGGMSTGACYYRGLRGFGHIDEARMDVVDFGLRWEVPGVPEDTARQAQQRLRKRLEGAGWKLTHDGNRTLEELVELGYRYQQPGGEDHIDVRWNNRTTTLVVTVYAPCGQVRPGSLDTEAAKASWAPVA